MHATSRRACNMSSLKPCEHALSSSFFIQVSRGAAKNYTTQELFCRQRGVRSRTGSSSRTAFVRSSTLTRCRHIIIHVWLHCSFDCVVDPWLIRGEVCHQGADCGRQARTNIPAGTALLSSLFGDDIECREVVATTNLVSDKNKILYVNKRRSIILLVGVCYTDGGNWCANGEPRALFAATAGKRASRMHPQIDSRSTSA